MRWIRGLVSALCCGNPSWDVHRATEPQRHKIRQFVYSLEDVISSLTL